jgi:hypothetical protein
MKKRLDFRIEEFEFEILEEYCNATGRTKTDILRELIRSLKTKKKPSSEGRGLYPRDLKGQLNRSTDAAR